MALVTKVKVVFGGLVFALFLHLLIVTVFFNNKNSHNTTLDDLSSVVQLTARIQSSDLTQYENTHKKPLLLLFTTFKDSSVRSEINNNTIEYWSLLRPWVQPLLFVENTSPHNSIVKLAKDRGWWVHRAPTLRKQIPVLRDMFLRAEQIVSIKTPYIAYANSDILFKMDLVETLLFLHAENIADTLNQSTLVIGRRTTILSSDLLTGASSTNRKYSLHDLNLISPRAMDIEKAVDYFITMRDQFPWEYVPDFVVGKPGYDNWLPAKCFDWDISPIDASLSITAMHQVLELSNSEGGWKSPDVCMNRDLVDPFDYSKGRTVCAPYYTKKLSSSAESNTDDSTQLQLRTRGKQFHVAHACAEPDSYSTWERIRRTFSFKRREKTCREIATWRGNKRSQKGEGVS